MVYLNIRGGAGNQFSEYAFARYLLYKRGDKDRLKINIQGAFGTMDNGFVEDDDFLQYYNVYPYEYTEKKNAFIFYRILYRITKFFPYGSKIYNSGMRWISKRGVYSLERDMYVDVVSKSRNIYIEGNYENPWFYDCIHDILLNEFQPRENTFVDNQNLMNGILNSESICISIRKWKKEVLNERRKQLSPLWFKKALCILISKIKKPVSEIKIYVFADDLEWAKKVEFGYPVIYEEPGNTVHEKIRLMSACKHFILSNSTFSWWAQYLSSNNQKYVIFPYSAISFGFFSHLDPPAGVEKDHWIPLDEESGCEIRK